MRYRDGKPVPEPRPFAKGDVVLFTSGEYSDKGNDGLFRALVDGDFTELWKAFIGATEPARHNTDGFQGWLSAEQRVLDEIAFSELHRKDIDPEYD